MPCSIGIWNKGWFGWKVLSCTLSKQAQCRSSHKLVILCVIIAAAVIVLGLEGIVCCLFYCPLKGFQAIHVGPYENYNTTPIVLNNLVDKHFVLQLSEEHIFKITFSWLTLTKFLLAWPAKMIFPWQKDTKTLATQKLMILIHKWRTILAWQNLLE